MMSKQDLIRLIDNDRDAHLQFLSSLIQIPSPNPPGDTREALNFVRNYLTEHGISSEMTAPKLEAPNLVSNFCGGAQPDPEQSRNLVLNGHIDVFPVNDGESWQRDPYSGHIADGFVHGRGAVDMKAGTAADIIAFTYVHRYRDLLRGSAVLEVVSDEETGGRYGTKYLIESDERKELWRGDCVLNAEPGGDSIRFGEKGTLRMSFEVSTHGGHGAYIHRSEGAIRIAAKVIHELLSLEDLQGKGMDPDLHKYLQREDVRAVADHIMGEGAAESIVRPTVNVGTIRSSGSKVNMIPTNCQFELDVRLPIRLTKDTVLAEIDHMLTSFPQVSYAVQEAATNPSAASPRDHKLVTLLQANAELVKGERPLPISSLGATDCKHFRYNSIPAYSYGPSLYTMAERDERVSEQEFLDVLKIHTLVAWDYLGGPS